ncbi:16S rRNA m(7)G-527 methyltransferase [Niastella koreensis GR20-10]|uniref:Ribosomal RNA small subunit methyltransferase G n=1 Tax=Niastella koreensis (strain DSM 17620 / KACC 11465 / NBRC 106392 / GR20-10) TaxID=700598 RepID=G8TH87_NIAKG|nr:16S rRNA (guanine(527)-N(7))-methyltransferase RsmG [Niastella koreensis]AEW01697.1 16S rRNA m(7)G-527 methyltransferase [Niastella koreensis GR20-10]
MEKAQQKLELITKYFGDFSPVQLQQFAALDELYNDWNSKINVISRKDMESLYEKHVLHSLAIATAFEFRPGSTIVDLGTGGGFPGIPLAIFFPEVKFLLVDSIGKKLKVVDAVAEALELKNVTTRHTRIEEIKDKKFDFVVSRAVAPLKDLWQWSKPLLKKAQPNSENQKPGLICLKGGDLSQEISESGCRPRLMEVFEIFGEEYFKEKYMLYVSV